ncbi:MAG: hypothetical protein Q8L66_08545 [Caulobacter sp.]|nr:hypothetical protein [Caulobacter sp.]
MNLSNNQRGKGRPVAVIAASLAAHGLVLALLGLVTPTLTERALSPPSAFDVEIWTPPTPSRRPADPVSIRRRPAEPSIPPPGIQPRPRASTVPAADDAAPTGMAPVFAFPGQRDGLRRALRGSTVGCANRDAVGLTRREREACDEVLGKGAADAKFIEPPMDPAKRAAFAAAARRKALTRERKEDPTPPGIDPTDNAGGTRTNGIGILGY